MGLKHGFSLVDIIDKNDYSVYLNNKPIVDEIYMEDVIFLGLKALSWIKTFNPSKKKFTDGFNYHGESVICQMDQIEKILDIISNYISLYTLSPDKVEFEEGFDLDKLRVVKVSYKKKVVLKQLEELEKLLKIAVKENKAVYHRGI